MSCHAWNATRLRSNLACPARRDWRSIATLCNWNRNATGASKDEQNASVLAWYDTRLPEESVTTIESNTSCLLYLSHPRTGQGISLDNQTGMDLCFMAVGLYRPAALPLRCPVAVFLMRPKTCLRAADKQDSFGSARILGNRIEYYPSQPAMELSSIT